MMLDARDEVGRWTFAPATRRDARALPHGAPAPGSTWRPTEARHAVRALGPLDTRAHAFQPTSMGEDKMSLLGLMMIGA